MSQSTANPVFRRLARGPLILYRWHVGWLLGHRFLLLVHTGRRSGLEHRAVLEVLHYDPNTSVVAVMAGFGRRCDWYQNLQAHPAAKIVLGRQSFPASGRDLSEDEAVTVLAEYEHRNRIAAPLVRWTLSQLVGWPYDGTDRSRRVPSAATPARPIHARRTHRRDLCLRVTG